MKHKYHRISDHNDTLTGLVTGKKTHLSFEATFYLDNSKALVFHGRGLDSNGNELISSSGPVIFSDSLDKYRSWDPSDNFLEAIKGVETESVKDEPVLFGTPYWELNLEIKGPVGSRDTFPVTVNMSQAFSLLGNHKLEDSGVMSIGMLVQKESLIAFLRNLHSDLQKVIAQRAG